MVIYTAVLSFFVGTSSITGHFIAAFPYFGYFNGYTAGKYYRFFNGSSWKTLSFLSTIFYPMVLFSGYFMVDWIDPRFASKLFGKEGVSAETFGYLWLFINFPTTFFGAYRGFTSPKIMAPTKQSRLERDIPSFS